MKKFLLLLSVLSLIPVRSGAAAEDHGSAYDRVVQAQTLRCGYTLSAPYLIRDAKTGAVTGIWADLMQEVGRQLSLRIDWKKEISPADAAETLNSGDIDALCTGYLITPARAKQISFTLPFYYDALYIIARADDNRFDGNRPALNAKTVRFSVLDGTAPQSLTQENFPAAQLQVLSKDTSPQERYRQVMDGRADVTMATLGGFRAFTEHYPGRLKIVRGPPIWAGKAGIGVAKQEIELWQMLNGAAETLNDNGFTKQVLARYRHPDKPPPAP